MEKNKIIFMFLFAQLLLVVIVPFILAEDSYLVEISDVSPNILVPGEETTLTFEIENLGESDITNVIFSWEEETGAILPIGSSNTKTIEEISDDESEELKFNVFTSASADPGLYELVLTLRFSTENGTILTETSKAGIIVGGTTDFEIVVSDFSSGEILLSITNLGKNDASSVIVSIPEQTGFKTTTTSSSIVGDLVKGDYSIVSFQLSGSGSYLNVDISYTDTTGIRQKVTKQVFIEQSFSDSNSNFLTGSDIQEPTKTNSVNLKLIFFIFAGVSLTALLIIGISLHRAHKKKNENS